MTLPSFLLDAASVWPVADVDVDKADVREWGGTVQAALNALLSNSNLINGRLVASVAANSLTIAVKTAAGNDPSDDDPVYAVFRDDSLPSGIQDVVSIITALSLVVPATATLGTTNAIPFRLWLVIINDAGTIRLGITNLYSGGTFYPLSEIGLIDAVDPIANSAGVIYSNVDVSLKPFRILGVISYETALVTAGVWDTAPDIVALMSPGMKRPGERVQFVRNSISATASGATTIPHDNTIPQQSTEGVEFITQAITPKSKANVLRIRVSVWLSTTALGHLIAALFQDAVENALVARSHHTGTNNTMVNITLEYLMLAGQITSTTFKVKGGGSAAGTFRVNGVSGAQIFGGVGTSSLEIEELAT